MEVEESIHLNGNQNGVEILTNGSTTKLPSSTPTPTPIVQPIIDPESFTGELPIIMNDLIPLSVIIERLVSQAYSDLVNLAEILPSTPDAARKRAIVDWVLQTRRQILKLLVLVRWSSEAGNVSKCRNIVGFLSRQNYEFDHAVEGLTEVKAMLAGARVRNYDIPTAISVLTTGTYTALPSIIKETFGAPEKLEDEAVEKTIEELEEVLRWRLSCVERLPKAMQSYRIDKGRATFRVEGVWEAEFTYGGDNQDSTAEWFLLNLKFLFRVKDARGVWSSSPVGPMKDHIIELCNSELARRLAPPTLDVEVIEGIVEASIAVDFVDIPLIRGYNFLQRLVSCYQLEALYNQALSLAATVWSGNLRVDFSTDRKTLKIEYWAPPPAPSIQNKPRTSTPSLPLQPPIPPSSQSVIISIDEEEVDATDKDTLKEVKKDLKIIWSAEGLKESLKEERKGRVQLKLDSDLDLESLLLSITRHHAREATLQLYSQLLVDLDPLDLTLLPSPSSSSSVITGIQIHLHGPHYVIASVNTFSGKLELNAVGEVSSSREVRLRNAAEKVDRDRKLMGETLLRVRASTILDEVDSRAAYLGIQTLRRLPLRPQDIAKFGSATRQFLFLKLHPQLAFHYLVLVMTEEGFRFALISVKEGSDHIQTWMGIEELGWVDKTSLVAGATGKEGIKEWRSEEEKAKPHDFDVSIDDLRDLHLYCIRRISFFKIEQQLHVRRIPYQTVASHLQPTSKDSNDNSTSINNDMEKTTLLIDSAPYLVIQSSDLIRSPIKVAYSNIAIQSCLKDNIIKTTLHVRFRDLSLVNFPDSSDLPSFMSCDPLTWTVTFTSDDLDNCIPSFLTAYSVINRAVLLARHNKSVQKQSEAAAGAEMKMIIS